MDDFEKYLDKAKQDPVFQEAWEALEPIYALRRQLIELRIQENITQEEAARRIGISRSALARLESGKFNPTLKSLQRIAKGLGKKLIVTFS